MSKIIIDIDVEKKGIKEIKLPDELNPIEVVLIFNSVTSTLLSKIKMEKEPKIKIPKQKIIIGS